MKTIENHLINVGKTVNDMHNKQERIQLPPLNSGLTKGDKFVKLNVTDTETISISQDLLDRAYHGSNPKVSENQVDLV